MIMEAHELKAVRADLHTVIYQTSHERFDVQRGHGTLHRGIKFSKGMETTIGKKMQELAVLVSQKEKLDEVIEKTQFSINGFIQRQYEARRKIADIAISNEILRIRIFSRDGWKCKKCLSPTDLTIDHIKSVKRGGGNDDENLQSLCRSCNSSKGSKP